MEQWQGAVGLVILPALAWLCSENRRVVPWRAALVAVALQFALAGLLLKVPGLHDGLLLLNGAVTAVSQATGAGTSMVFGYLGGAPLPFSESYPGAAFILAFQALPLILVISALSALLWHWRVLPVLVAGFAWLLRRGFGISGPLGLGAAANVFVGMVEAPLLIRPVLASLSRSDLFVLMTTGMATIAGTVLVLYATILEGVVPDPVAHILTASVISVPAAILIARLLVPADAEPGKAVTDGRETDARKPPYAGAMDAITRGTQDGLTLLLSVAAMLIVLVALVALLNAALGLLPDWAGSAVTLERILGLIFQPYAWLLGVPWAETEVAGALIGKKTVLNELLAYLDFARLEADALGERSRIILLYALCGFANPGSLGIMIGGLAAMVPERRGELVALGPRSILAGTLATGMTGAVVGLLI